MCYGIVSKYVKDILEKWVGVIFCPPPPSSVHVKGPAITKCYMMPMCTITNHSIFSTVCIGVLNKIYKAIPAEDSSNQDKILESLQDVCAGLKGKEHKFVS